MIIDTSLDTLMLPALPTYQNEFGTKRLSGGLTTAECTDGVMIWGRRQRPYPVTETSETTKVETHCTFEVTTAGIELTIADATFAGCEAKVINASDGAITVKGGVSGLNGSAAAVTIPSRAMLFLTFFEGWITSNSTYSGNTEVSDFEKRIFLASHPINSYYKTDDPRNPADVYGGTWKQIKDRVLIAAGDSFPAGSTGGQTSITLAVDNLPSHSHSFTPKGSVSSHSHGKGTLETDSKGGHYHRIMTYTGNTRLSLSNTYSPLTNSSNTGAYRGFFSFGAENGHDVPKDSTSVSALQSGSEYNGYIGMAKYGSGYRSLIESDGAHTHPVTGRTGDDTPTFTGTAGVTNGTGSGTAINIMNPYRAVYTWKRTA